MKISCSKCGKKIDRTKDMPNPVCFSCKKIVRAEYNKRVKEGKVKAIKRKIIKRTIKITEPIHIKVENPHEDFSKFGGSLIINIPRKLSKKKQELKDWAQTKYKNCFYCGKPFTIIYRKDNDYSTTKICESSHCIMRLNIHKILTWTK